MKSHLSDCLEIWRSIYYDACAISAVEISQRDVKTTTSRARREGLSFLTITLPNFARDFEQSLEQGQIDPSFFRNFRKNGAIPAFLQGMLGRLFSRESGRINDVEIHDSPDTFAQLVACVRQICLAFKKIELPCTPERENAALENFIVTEQSFEMFTLSGETLAEFSAVSDVLWRDVLRNIRMDLVFPRHGPGATSERASGNQKFAWKYWHDRLEPHFPLIDTAYPISIWEKRFERDELARVSILSEDQEIPVRVTPVPKTLKGPRIIAIEPCCMQFAQQGIRSLLYEAIESNRYTLGHINFRDQSINQLLALKNSISRDLCTIDLSDASDRVPLDLAMLMFDSHPDLRDAILACRSSSAKMPDGRVIGPLRKFASMGSALCFPIEAMYFYTICIVALLRAQNLPVSPKTIYGVGRKVYVYGDDILVPRKHAATVLDHLKKYNCKVNANKTFIHGFFRESCGVDGYLGKQVQPVYVGTVLPENRRQFSSILSSVETGNHFFERGYISTSTTLFRKVEKVTGPLPSVPKESPVIGRNFPYHPSSSFRRRYNKDLQVIEFLLPVPTPVYRTDLLEGYAALRKSLYRLEGLLPEHYKTRPLRPNDKYVDYIDSIVAVDEKHLERTARHGVVAIQLRWVTATLAGYGN